MSSSTEIPNPTISNSGTSRQQQQQNSSGFVRDSNMNSSQGNDKTKSGKHRLKPHQKTQKSNLGKQNPPDATRDSGASTADLGRLPTGMTEGSQQTIDLSTGTAFENAPPGFDRKPPATSQDVRIAPPPGFGPPPGVANNENRQRGNPRAGTQQNRRVDRDGYRRDGDYRGQRPDHRTHRPRNFKNRIDHAGVKMTGRRINCLICCQESDLYGISTCLHPLCMECAIRVRILGKTNTCPQCRTDIEMLYFVQAPQLSAEFKLPSKTMDYVNDEKYGIKFENKYAIECFESYMSHKCNLCSSRGEEMSFETFAALQQHISQAHQLTFCHLCNENVNVLTKDKKTYTRQNLQKHMNGDLAEDGSKGHPKCLFCDQRFYDDEAQYKHLRKDHYFCQICDVDGAENFFYKNHYELSRHYKKAHLPCDNRECESMGIVFRTELELQVHKAKQHTSGAQRPLQLDFQYTRINPGGSQRGNQGTSQPSTQSVQNHHAEHSNRSENFTIVPSAQINRQPVRIIRSAFNSQSASDFPNLDNAGALYGAPPNWRMEAQAAQQQARQPAVSMQSGEQFPSLSGGQSGSASGKTQEQSVWSKNKIKTMEEVVSKKGKKKKSKTVPINSIVNRNEVDFVPSSSKFELLSAFDEGSDATAGSNNWWNKPVSNQAARKPTPKPGDAILTPTTDDFVRIQIARPVENDTQKSEMKPTMSLKSIAMAIESTDANGGESSRKENAEPDWEKLADKIEERIDKVEKEPQIDNSVEEKDAGNSSEKSIAEKLLSDLFTFCKK
ncbi:E3 ubiquitin-protein ligase [Ditylenchus destructor]|nr:E3 ubiquitin-protein ligase [Ditylenchus destructor]